MTVSEAFSDNNLSLDDIDLLTGSQYWDAVHSFIEENWDKYIDTMSLKQQEWVEKIIGDLLDD